MDRRDRFEELFRERLHNWECEPDSEQWENPRWFSSSTTYPVFHQIHTPDGSYRNPPFTRGRRTLIRSSYPGNYDRNSPKQNTTFYCGSYTNTTAYRNSYDGSNSRFTPPCSHSKTYLHNWKKRFQRINIKVKKLKYYL